MNKLKKVALLFTLAILATVNLNAQKKVAVVTFYVDKHISFDQIGGGAALVAAIGSLSENENFDLTSVLNNFHETFFNTISPWRKCLRADRPRKSGARSSSGSGAITVT